MVAFAVLNLKGGVGKTTVAFNLGAAISSLGKRVLLIDLDPQHDLTGCAGIDPFSTKGIEFLLEKDLSFEAVRHVYDEKLHILPAGKKLKDLEMSLSNILIKAKNSYFCYLLKNVIEPEQENYDFVLIDCQPSVGFLTVNALSYVDHVMMPVQCQHLGMEALKRTMTFISKIRKFNGITAKASAVVPTMYDVRNRLSENIILSLKERFNGTLTSTIIRVNVSLAEAPAYQKTIFEYAPQSHGAEDFLNLGKEIIHKFG